MRVHPVKETNTWQKIKNYCKEYCKISNIHGVHYLTARRSNIERLTWAFFLLLSMSCCIFMIYKIWEKYENNPIIINFASKEVSIYDVPFPAVTVCPDSKCSSFSFNYTDVYYKLRDQIPVSDDEFKIFQYMYMLCDDGVNSLGLNGTKTVDDDFFTIMSELKPSFGTLCIFLGETNFCENGTLIPIVTEEGICYSFNILKLNEIYKKNVIFYEEISSMYDQKNSDFNIDTGYVPEAVYPRRAYTSGISAGFQLVLQILPLQTDALCNSLIRGYEVLIHSPLDIPLFSKHHFHIAYNKATMIAIQPDLITTSEEVKKIHPQKRKCYLGSERPLKYFQTYTQSNCLLECITNFTLKECGCVSYFMPRTSNIKVCGIGSEECIEHAQENMVLQEVVNKHFQKSTIKCDCKPSCNNWQYNYEISEVEFDFKKYMTLHFKQQASELDNAETSAIIIYFKNEHFMSLERTELYSVLDFISNFGGLLGLFIGFSLLSLVEIIYFFTLRIFYNNRLFGGWFDSV